MYKKNLQAKCIIDFTTEDTIYIAGEIEAFITRRLTEEGKKVLLGEGKENKMIKE